ncbi:MAG: BMP family ABC transporter substrate-binding protein [Rubrimonas sp.]
MVAAAAGFAPAVLGAGAAAQSAGPAIVYSVGGRFDGSFNQSAAAGVEAWTARSGRAVAEYEPRDVGQMGQALRRFASRGHDPVIAVGFLQAGAVTEAAAAHPDTRFTLIDAVVEAPNVQSIVYREHEGAYVVGVLAGMASRSGVVGVVGGMDIPLIRRVACGFAQGVKHVSPSATVLYNAAGDTPAAWNDPARGAELARAQIAQGADVVVQAAGGTGLGVLQAAADAGILGVGTDSNQNGLHPGRVLTSLLKRTDVAVLAAIEDWAPGVTSLGLEESGLEWALDDDNAPLIDEGMRANALFAAAAIAGGDIRVHDSSTEGPCPYL